MRNFIALLLLLLPLGSWAGPTGAADTVMRMPASGSGKVPRFGSIDLSKSAAVGSSILPAANGGTSVASAGSAGNILYSNGTTWLSSAVDGASMIRNVGLSVSISSNQLVVALKQGDGSTDCTSASPCMISVRSATLTTGSYSTDSVTAAMSVTIPTAASLGVIASVAQTIHVFYISDTTKEVCVSQQAFDDGTYQSPTAISAGATSASTLYCTNSHTSKPVRYIGSITATWSNPNWGTIARVALQPASKGINCVSTTATAGSTPSGSTAGSAGSNGTVNWTAPYHTNFAFVCGRGGGGGGGGGSNLANTASGMGGGGTQTMCNWVAVTPNTTYTLTAGKGGVGAAGVNGTAGDGTDGTDSSVGSLITFAGGHRGIGGGNRDQSKVENYVWYGAACGGHGGTGKTTTTGPQAGAPSAFSQGGASAGASDGGGGGGGDSAGGTGGPGNSTSPGSPGNNGNSGSGGGGGGYSSGASAGGAGGSGGAGFAQVCWQQ